MVYIWFAEIQILEDNDLIKANFAQRILSVQFQWHIAEQDQGYDSKWKLILVRTGRHQMNLMAT